MYLAIALSTDIQNWHDYNAFLLPNSTEQYELIDMLHYHESCISRFSCSLVWWGARAACAEVSTGSVEASKAKHSPGLHMEPSIYRRFLINDNTIKVQ
jgi:hypothetical protein